MRTKILSLIIVLTILICAIPVNASNPITNPKNVLLNEEIAVRFHLPAMTLININKAADKYMDMKKHPLRQDVGKLTVIKFVSGCPDRTFRPNVPMKVSEYIKLVMLALCYKPATGNSIFADTYAKAAIQKKIINTNEFNNYSRNITRQEAARIISKAALLFGETSNSGFTNLLSAKVKDISLTSSNDKWHVINAFGLGLMPLYPDATFKPQKSLTRAEACAIIVKFLDTAQRKPYQPSKNDFYVMKNPNGGETTLFPTMKLEVIHTAKAFKTIYPKSKGYVYHSFNVDDRMLMYTFFTNKSAADSANPDEINMGIDIDTYYAENNMKHPYYITVYDPKIVKSLHLEVISGIFKYWFASGSSKVYNLFKQYLEYGINGDSKNRSAELIVNKRTINIYKGANDKRFKIIIGSKKE